MPVDKPIFNGVGTPTDILGAVKEVLICLTVFYLLDLAELV